MKAVDRLEEHIRKIRAAREVQLALLEAQDDRSKKREGFARERVLRLTGDITSILKSLEKDVP